MRFRNLLQRRQRYLGLVLRVDDAVPLRPQVLRSRFDRIHGVFLLTVMPPSFSHSCLTLGGTSEWHKGQVMPIVENTTQLALSTVIWAATGRGVRAWRFAVLLAAISSPSP
jgi:hypothetical protein